EVLQTGFPPSRRHMEAPEREKDPGKKRGPPAGADSRRQGVGEGRDAPELQRHPDPREEASPVLQESPRPRSGWEQEPRPIEDGEGAGVAGRPQRRNGGTGQSRPHPPSGGGDGAYLEDIDRLPFDGVLDLKAVSEMVLQDVREVLQPTDLPWRQ